MFQVYQYFETPDSSWSNMGMVGYTWATFSLFFFCMKREHTERAIFWAIYQVHRER